VDPGRDREAAPGEELPDLEELAEDSMPEKKKQPQQPQPKKPKPVNLDEDIENADWPKRTPDFPLERKAEKQHAEDSRKLRRAFDKFRNI